MEMRAKIAEIINEWLLGLNLHPDTADRIADQILALPLDDFEVVRECPDCMGKGGRDDYYSPFGVGCFKCHSIGTIIRPLTVEDVPHLLNQMIIIHNTWAECALCNITDCKNCANWEWVHDNYMTLPDGGKVRRKG